MNYLAHLYCSCDSPESIAGALLGDFAKGRAHEAYSPRVQQAIALHRAIDRFTDGHPVVHASRAVISPARRRFAPILVDVFYDHFLARHWRRYSTQSLDHFAQRVYRVLAAQRHGYPERLQRVVPRMIAGDWLCAYGQREGMDAALRGIAWRLARYRRAAVLRGAVEELDREYPHLEGHFHEFFPELVGWVRERDGITRACCA